uniref:Uncharacterized protein n=1 Tax=Arundo donax TaxID=35708 RepID=A0A0A9ERN0_ARUDO
MQVQAREDRMRCQDIPTSAIHVCNVVCGRTVIQEHHVYGCKHVCMYVCMEGFVFLFFLLLCIFVVECMK